MTPNEEYIIELLLDSSLISSHQVEVARDRALAEGTGVVQALTSAEIVTAEDVTRTIAAAANMDFVDLSQILVRPEVIDLIPRDKAHRYKAVPIALNDGILLVAISDPLNFDTLDNLRFLLKREIETVCATPEQINQALVKYYGSAEEAGDILMGGLGGSELAGTDLGTSVEEESGSGDSAIIKLVSLLILEAYKIRASDIHLEPLEKRFRIRFRIDGVLQEMQNPPKKLQSAIVSRLKIMSGTMSIAEKRLPQDGRIQVKMGKNTIDLRVSTIPTNHGESVVMRILDKSSLTLGLPELGFLTDDQSVFERMILLPDGILLVTGPTGSGKTTTLYACLNYINRPDRKIITVEDPVEYQMSRHQPGAGQRRHRDDFPGRVAFDAAAGAEHHHDRRDPRFRDGQHRDQREPDGPPGFQHPAHQRRARRRSPAWSTWASSRSWWPPPSAPSWPSGWCASFAASASNPAR